MTTICDRCSAEIEEEESNTCDVPGDWERATLCNECYAEIASVEETET